MKLVFINKIGKNWKGNYIYEFLFSDLNLEDIDGEGWDSYPSSGNPIAPEDFIKDSGSLVCELQLDLVQESDSFAMWDAVDGVIAMAWENMEGYDEYIKQLESYKNYIKTRPKNSRQVYDGLNFKRTR